MKLGSHRIGPEHPTYVIAEIGINHEGDAGTCLDLVRAAVLAGADAVKLQTVDPDENYPPNHPSYALYARSRLTRQQTAAAFALARQLGIDAFTTNGFSDLDWIEQLDPVAYKISSGLITHIPLIEKLASMGRPMLLSTGMSEAPDIDAAVKAARGVANIDLSVMQCTSLYPAPIETVSLRSINWLAQRYGVAGGFSDHTREIVMPALAVMAGATIIEKHFSLDPARTGFDHPVSLSPAEFTEMVRLVRMADAARGQAEKSLAPQQADMATRMRRGLIAARDIAAGAVIVPDDLTLMRPHDGRQPLSYAELPQVIGRTADRFIAKWSSITYDCLSAPQA